MNILIAHFNKTSLDNVNCDEKDLKTIIHVTYMAFHNRFKQRKAFKNKIIKQLMLVAWLPKIWWDWCVLKNKKKVIKNI